MCQDCVNAVNRLSQSCANPFCKAPVKIKSPRGKHGRFCSPRCRMDGYALRRVKAIHELLDKL